MENQHYNHVNQNDKNNDYYNRSSSTTTSSSSTTTTTTIGRETETTSADSHMTTGNSQEQLQSFRKFLTQMFMEHFEQDYQDAICQVHRFTKVMKLYHLSDETSSLQ